MLRAHIVVITARDASAVLPPEHTLAPVTVVTPERARAALREHRSGGAPVVAVVDGLSAHAGAAVADLRVTDPDVPVIIAAAGDGSSSAAVFGIRRPARSAALLESIETAARRAVQHARVRTTLEQFNIRLREGAVAGDERQQRRLLLSGLYFATVLEQANDGIFVTDRQGVVALWNRAAERLFGAPADRVIGRSINEIGIGGSERTLMDLVTHLSPAAPTASAELRVQTPGAAREIEVSLSLVFDPGEQAIAVSAIARDVTERNALVQELRQKADALAASNRHKEEFLAVLSHELRTPLNAILGWVQILETTPADPRRVRRAITVIRRNAELQHHLVMDLLDYARMAAGQLQLSIEPHDLAELTSATVDSFRPEMQQRNLTVTAEYLEGPTLPVDGARLRQVLSNLLSNAIKFTPSGGRIDVRVRRSSGGAEIEVSDTGRGIDPSFLPHVFDDFRQAEPSITRTEQGLGLGLAIARRLVELHGGTISARSEGRDRGATFLVALPETAGAVQPAGQIRTPEPKD